MCDLTFCQHFCFLQGLEIVEVVKNREEKNYKTTVLLTEQNDFVLVELGMKFA